MQIQKYISLIALVMMMPVYSVHAVTQEELNQEVEGLVNEYNAISNITPRSNAAVPLKSLGLKLSWSGITDQRLFDLMEKDLLKSIDNGIKKKNAEVDSWIMKSLAASGDEKYTKTLELVLEKGAEIRAKKKKTKHSKHERYALQALGSIDQYHEWNKTINKDIDSVPFEDIKYKRIANMLDAKDPQAVLHISKLIVHSEALVTDKRVTDLINKRLGKYYFKERSSAYHGKAIAWMCRALGESKNKEYKETVAKVHANAHYKTVKKWAMWAYRQLR